MNNPYVIGFTKTALDRLKRLDRVIAQRMIEKLLRMAQNIEVVPHEAMTGEWYGCYRFKVGDYRVIYQLELDERLIIVVSLGHRRDVYDE